MNLSLADRLQNKMIDWKENRHFLLKAASHSAAITVPIARIIDIAKEVMRILYHVIGKSVVGVFLPFVWTVQWVVSARPSENSHFSLRQAGRSVKEILRHLGDLPSAIVINLFDPSSKGIRKDSEGVDKTLPKGQVGDGPGSSLDPVVVDQSDEQQLSDEPQPSKATRYSTQKSIKLATTRLEKLVKSYNDITLEYQNKKKENENNGLDTSELSGIYIDNLTPLINDYSIARKILWKAHPEILENPREKFPKSFFKYVSNVSNQSNSPGESQTLVTSTVTSSVQSGSASECGSDDSNCDSASDENVSGSESSGYDSASDEDESDFDFVDDDRRSSILDNQRRRILNTLSPSANVYDSVGDNQQQIYSTSEEILYRQLMVYFNPGSSEIVSSDDVDLDKELTILINQFIAIDQESIDTEEKFFEYSNLSVCILTWIKETASERATTIYEIENNLIEKINELASKQEATDSERQEENDPKELLKSLQTDKSNLKRFVDGCNVIESRTMSTLMSASVRFITNQRITEYSRVLSATLYQSTQQNSRHDSSSTTTSSSSASDLSFLSAFAVIDSNPTEFVFAPAPPPPSSEQYGNFVQTKSRLPSQSDEDEKGRVNYQEEVSKRRANDLRPEGSKHQEVVKQVWTNEEIIKHEKAVLSILQELRDEGTGDTLSSQEMQISRVQQVFDKDGIISAQSLYSLITDAESRIEELSRQNEALKGRVKE